MEQLVDTFKDNGIVGLVIVSILGSVILPIPPDTLLIPLGLSNPDMVLCYAVIALIASLFGAAWGYLLGLKGGRMVLNKLFKAEEIRKAENLFAKHSTIAIIIAGFSPLPYNLITITSGVFMISFKKLVFCSIISRGTRFFLLAVIIIVMGESTREFLISYKFVYLIIIAATISLLLYGLYWIVKKTYKKPCK